MLRLAVTTAAETLDRMRDPLAARDITVKTAETLGIDYLGVDILVSEGRAVISETNARPTVDDEKYESGFRDRLAGLIRRTADNK